MAKESETYSNADLRHRVSRRERKEYLMTAQDLCYPDWVIKRIRSAETVMECEMAMLAGRESEEYGRMTE